MKKFLLLILLVSACEKTSPAAPDPHAEKVAAARARPVPAEGRRVDVVVSKRGYEPAKIDVKAGEAVTLVFTRVDDTKCGEELVIPSLGFKKLLPLNEPVTVAFEQDLAGEVGFACGMDMMKGQLVVK